MKHKKQKHTTLTAFITQIVTSETLNTKGYIMIRAEFTTHATFSNQYI